MEDELIKQVWDETLTILKETIGEPTYGTWIVPLVPHSLEENCFCALTGQNLSVQILQKNQKDISAALSPFFVTFCNLYVFSLHFCFWVLR